MDLSDLALWEERVHHKGYTHGITAATDAGDPVPRHLGYHRGLYLGRCIGHYLATVTYHLHLYQKDTDIYNEKIVKLLIKVKDLCEQFPHANMDVDIDSLMTDIQAQYRKLCSLLKIEVFNPDADAVTF